MRHPSIATHPSWSCEWGRHVGTAIATIFMFTVCALLSSEPAGNITRSNVITHVGTATQISLARKLLQVAFADKLGLSADGDDRGVRLAPSGQYEREMLASKAARRINTAEEKAIKGQYERTDTRSGHVSEKQQAMMGKAAVDALQITDAQLNRLEALAARARAEAATKQTTHLDSIMGFGNRTLERLSALHDQLSKAKADLAVKVAKHIMQFAGSPINCTRQIEIATEELLSSPEGPQKLKNLLYAKNSSEMSFYANQAYSNVDKLNATVDDGPEDVVTVSVGDTFSKMQLPLSSPLLSCDPEAVPELPVLITWLVGLDSTASQVQPPKILRTVRNVVLAMMMAVTIVCLGFCLGSRPEHTPMETSLPAYGRHVPSAARMNVFAHNAAAHPEMKKAAQGARDLFFGRTKASLE
mmetsp:Transcript_10283/g.19457  ORF Transcript_10283/g.19457 Transcript_10283/m.19457 type:complete len:414 (+) Transcript_10283:73-1314(+)